MLRILATAFGPVPGSNAHTSALIGMAVAVRGEIDMITVKTDQLGHLERFGESRMFRVPVQGTRPEQRAAFARAVGRQIASEPYDVVHVRGPEEGLVAAKARAVQGFRFIYEVATYPDESEGPEAERTWSAAHQICLKAADLVLVPTEAAGRHLDDLGIGGKTAVVSPGVDVNAFDYWPSAQDDTLRLLYLGPFGADRDLVTLLSAVRSLREQRSVMALIAGEADPAQRARVASMVDAFGLNAIVDVRAEPRPRSLPIVIAACNVGVVSASASPRFQECGDLPEPLLEFMACRRPLIAAAVPGVAEVVRDEQEGLLYMPGDEASLIDAITATADGGVKALEQANRAYTRVREAFSASERRRRIAEVYEMLAPGSQQYDIWTEAFDPLDVALSAQPSSVFETPGHIETTTTVRPVPIGATAPPSIIVDDSGYAPDPPSPSSGDDGISTDENPIPADKTTVRAPDPFE